MLYAIRHMLFAIRHMLFAIRHPPIVLFRLPVLELRSLAPARGLALERNEWPATENLEVQRDDAVDRYA